MSSSDHQSELGKDSGGTSNGSKTFARSPLEYGSSLLGAGSPSYESRLPYKRAREIQQQEGVPAMFWSSSIGSTNSSPGAKTPVEPSIPEDIPSTETSPSIRRARAGTVPSRFTNNSHPLDELASLSLQPKHASSSIDLVSHATNLVVTPPSSVTPSRHPPYHPPPTTQTPSSSAAARLRSGSLTLPRSIYQSSSSTPFGPSIFSSSYVSRVGLSPASPAQSAFSRDDEQTPVKTLDYLGLADTPTPPRGMMMRGMATQATVMEHPQETNGLSGHEQTEPLPGYLSATSRLRDASRIRSYSVADKDKYDEEHAEFDYDEEEDPQVLAHSTYLQEVQTTPKSHYSNLFVDTHSPRPRASTTGVISSPPSLTADLFAGPLPHRIDPKLSRGMQQQYQNDSSQQNQISRPISGDDQHGQYYTPYTANPDDISSQPSRSLWLATVPQGVSQQHLENIFGQYGAIESSRVLSHKNCGFVNFVTVEDAVAARAALGGRELFPGTGGIKIGFAKVPSGIVLSPSPEPLLMAGSNNESTMQHLSASQRLDGSRSRSPALPPLRQVQTELIQILGDYGANESEIHESTESLVRAGNFQTFRQEIPSIPEPSPQRVYDAPKLRDIRKRIDNGTCSPEEIEHIALDMLSEIAELSSDYLGNTVVQKLFENCSEEVKTSMLREIAPHLASIGVHKNGTWAAQKIIDVARTDEQMGLITENLHPYTPALFLDQFGNYVVQCCLRFGQPWTDFIFESMMEKLWEMAQGRFGARAMRACLESHSASKEQQRLMAAVITLHSVRLATNANGALLLTWLLDTCNFPNRFKTLAPRLVTHLAKLCTHKLASLTVLKLINQRSEPEAREVILNALFTSEDENKVLKRILEDQIHGAAVIYKVLTSPFVADQSSAERRSQYIAVVRNMLQKLKVQPTQGYKRLMDEVGLADRTVATPPINGHRGPQRSTTPREYATPNTFAPGQFYSPQHTYTTSQQYVPQQQMDLLRTSQTDPSLLGLEIQGLGQIYSPQQLATPHHQHQDSAQAAYQYQQMLLLQQQQQRTFNGYSSSPSASQQQQTSHQQMYQPSPSAAQQSQFGGPLMSGQNLSPQGMGVYSVNGGGGTSPGYPFAPGDVYSANRRGQR